MQLPREPMLELRFGQGRLWAASQTSSSVYLLRADGASFETYWSDLPALDVLPSEGGAWIVTDNGLYWRPRYADATWWK
jgi:hypothetical protein